MLFGCFVFLIVAWRPALRGGWTDRSMVASVRAVLVRVWPVAALATILMLAPGLLVEEGEKLGQMVGLVEKPPKVQAQPAPPHVDAEQPADVAMKLRDKGWSPYRVRFDDGQAAWIVSSLDKLNRL